ncbi:MAG: glycosyltransferase [Bacteroidales bacterium]|nr:glycosyltransferase [Bacteroidales bacterium]
MPIAILHIVYSFDIGGLENGLVNLINHLPDEKYSHVICILSSGKKCVDRVRKPIRIYELHKKYGNDFSIPFKIASIIRKERIDIVHTRNWVTLVEGVLAGLMGRCRSLIHGEHGKEIEDTSKQPIRRKIAKRICFSFVNKVITVSDSLKDELINNSLCSPSKVESIVNGVDTDKFLFNNRNDKIKCRHKYKIPEDAFVVGSVGRLAKVKNYDLMVSICNAIKFDNFFFVIAGNGPDRRILEEKIKNEGLSDKFKLLGEQPYINEVLSTFDVFINTSHYEGISNTILEAMAKGIPVLANDTGGTSEIVDHEVTGFLVNKNSEESFLNYLKILYSNDCLYKTCSYNSRKAVEGKYSLSSMIKKYDKLYSTSI